jgi:hypothetical protein
VSGTMSERSDDKARLAQELLELLKSDISSRGKDRSGGSAGAGGAAGDGGPTLVESPGNAMAGGHQKRDNKRFTYPVLRVNIGTAGYNSIDWSIGGVQIRDYVGTLKQHARVKIAISEGKADSTYYSVDCRIARIDLKKRVLSLQFQNMSRGMFDWLSALQLNQSKKRA